MTFVPGFFLHCLVTSPFKRKENLVVKDLFSKFSYRYTKKEAFSFKLPFVYLKKALKLILEKNETTTFTGKTILYDNCEDFILSDKRYLDSLGLKDIPIFIRGRNHYNTSFLWKLTHCVAILFISLFIIPVAFLSRNKACKGIILLELAEVSLFVNTLKKSDCRTLLVLSAFEKDISFISFLLEKKLSIKIYLMLSNNPLRYFYQNVICDTIVFCVPFHFKQMERYKHNWFINRTVMWPPYGFQEIQQNKNDIKIMSNTIGIMSSGMELRKYLGHMPVGNNEDYNAEKAMIDAIALYSKERKDIKLIIYLHPLEKKNEVNIKFSLNYYRKIFATDVEFAPFELPSKKCFNLSDLTIASSSSVQLERLFAGFKTLFAPMGFLNNYFQDETLDAISAQDKQQLFFLIDKALKMNSEEFFYTYKLLPYRWDSYTYNVRLD